MIIPIVLHMMYVDVPTSTTDTGALDEEENYLSPIPRCEVRMP